MPVSLPERTIDAWVTAYVVEQVAHGFRLPVRQMWNYPCDARRVTRVLSQLTLVCRGISVWARLDSNQGPFQVFDRRTGREMQLAQPFAFAFERCLFSRECPFHDPPTTSGDDTSC
jgi:hypothetical protein